MTAFELAAQDRAAVDVAARIGADRIELCTALALGGLTPSIGLIEYAVARRDQGGVTVHVLVRPRTGGFEYTPDELDASVADIRAAVRAGADGVVVGALRGGELDRDALARFVAAADGACVTLHRAIDVLADPAAALVGLADLGIDRVLTSGGADDAGSGLDMIARMVASAPGLEIMAGGGVTVATVADLVSAGVDAVHASAKSTTRDATSISLGSAGAIGFEPVDEETALRLVRAVRDATIGVSR
ncbi:hypothetical protein MN032_17330 [Agromyces atrinae]|uniref:copper homeostasis protein CutC n=1 Tax=Agromyces atrinae TaxID=592376 RepID=UPI001F575D11|nr:copper homeostasis protein CutC [Agromyces atrinae]MCI2959449.1 hypothetical protein [Agromyces atrinae]